MINIKTVVLDGIESIGTNPFDGAINLKTVEFKGTKQPEYSINPFEGFIFESVYVSPDYEGETLFGFDISREGKCGETIEECKWQVNDLTADTMSLTITGNGDMTDWVDEICVPWYSKRNEIVSITLEGITSIGDYAFMNLQKVTKITIPKSVTSIGYMAFAHTGLKSLFYEGTTEPSPCDTTAFDSVLLSSFEMAMEYSSTKKYQKERKR